MNPHEVTRTFEAALCAYTGAPFAVATTSCTVAIQGAMCLWDHLNNGEARDVRIYMPRLSYVGVPAALFNAGYRYLKFISSDWQGEYRITPSPVWDSARRFTSGMYRVGDIQCLSFHSSKILGDTQGGAVILDNEEAANWLRRYFFDGRTYGADPKTDQVMYPSVHAYMSPDVAARLLWKLSTLPRHNADLPRSDYPDLSKLEAFR